MARFQRRLFSILIKDSHPASMHVNEKPKKKKHKKSLQRINAVLKITPHLTSLHFFHSELRNTIDEATVRETLWNLISPSGACFWCGECVISVSVGTVMGGKVSGGKARGEESREQGEWEEGSG